MTHLEKISNALNKWVNWVAGGALVAMMLLTVGNMFLRAIPGCSPFGFTAEVVGWLAALVAAFALGYTQINRGHVAVDIFVIRLRQRAQVIIDAIMSFMSMALFALIAWRTTELASRVWEIGLVSATLKITFFPLIYAVALGCAFLCLVLLLDFLKSMAQAVKR